MKHHPTPPDVLLLKRKGHKSHHRKKKHSFAQWFWSFMILGILIGSGYMAYEFHKKGVTVQNINQERFDNMETILAALNEYHRVHGTYPPAYEMNEKGERTLSWRVAILPYFLDANGNPRYMDLYNLFDRDKSWDYKDNMNLLDKMPHEYRSPISLNRLDEVNKGYLTNYLTIRNLRSVFPSDLVPVNKSRITDVLDETVAVIEVGDDATIEWTRPDDFEFDPLNPVMAEPRTFQQGTILCGMCSGKAKLVTAPVSVEELFKRESVLSSKTLVEENPWVKPFLRDNGTEVGDVNESGVAESVETESEAYRPGNAPE